MSQNILKDFVHQLHERYSVDALNMSTSDWIVANTTLRGRDFSFKDYEFQRRIIDDLHPNFSCMKIAQCGLTESQQRKMLAFLERNQGTTGIFTQPSQAMRDRLAKTRVKPLIEADPVFNKERDRGATRSSLLYQLGQSFLHISDCTEGSATGTPTDILFVDEIDLSDQKMVALFGSRLQNSDFKIRQHFSTPTHVAYGIDADFQASDQHEYMCRCPSCNHWQIPDFTPAFVCIPGLPDLKCLSEIDPSHLDLLTLDVAYVRCENCHKPLDLTDPNLREWVPLYPTRSLNSRGYRVRPFVTHRLTISYIVNQLLLYKRNNFIRGWWNTVIGKPFTGGNERLNPVDIEACLGQSLVPDIDPSEPVSVGIDTGVTCHVVLFRGADPLTSSVFSMETVHSEQLVAKVLELKSRYNVVAGGMDRHPQTVLANDVQRASEGKIWPIEYRGTKDINPVFDVTHSEVTHFQAERTALLDRVATRVRGRNLAMAGYGTQKQVVINHLTNMVRDEKPEEPARWLKIKPEDHYFHAMGMGITGMKIREYFDDTDKTDSRQTVGLMGVSTPKGNNLLGGRNSLVSGPLG